MDISTTLTMNNGIEVPQLGIGTWAMSGDTMIKALQWAFESGYRHIDTATYYKNEKEVGQAVRHSGIPREEIFVTSKVWPSDFGYNRGKKAFAYSLKQLDIDYVDLYLIHWPGGKKETEETWKAMLELEKDDTLKSIGVSNFSISELERLKDLGDLLPVTNQVRFHPFSWNTDLLDYCKSENILVTAYSPLGEGRKINDKRIVEIASNYNKTPAQILIRWGLQKGVIEIPKSSNKNRIVENAAVFDFDITTEDMQRLDNF